MNALLEPLASVVDGSVSEGVLNGAYQGHGVEARPYRSEPLFGGKSSQQTTGAGVHEVDMFHVALAGVGGGARWVCQSSPSSPLHQLAAGFTAGGLLRRFRPGEFKFEGVDWRREGVEAVWGKVLGRLPGPLGASGLLAGADKEVQERLIAAGLFDELEALRWGGYPFLPKVEFIPPGSELANRYLQSPEFARHEERFDERLRSAGVPGYRSILEEKMSGLEASAPGRLIVDVEAGKARVPRRERFEELLAHLIRIAEINLQANPPAPDSE